MADDYAYLSGLSDHPNRAGDTSNFNPVFAQSLANALRQANAQGLHLGVMSGYRDPGQTGSAYDAGGNSSHTYGLASDISGLDGPNGKITNQWAQIAAANGLHNPYGVGNTAEFNHWQLPPQPLEQTPGLLNQLKTAKASGNMQNVWNAYNGAQGTAVASTIARPATGAVAPNNDFLTALQHYESGGRNIPNTTQGTSSGQAQGYNQITTGTWNEFGGNAYAPDPLHATLDQQNAIAAKIPMGRWDPKTLAYLQGQGFKVDPKQTLAANIAMNGGTPGTTLNSITQNAPVSTAPGTASAGSSGSPVSAAATTAAGAVGTPGGPALPGFAPAQSNQFLQGASGLEKAMGGQGLQGQQGDGGGQDPVKPSPMIGQAQPPHMPNPQAAAQTMGQILNSVRTPLQWGSGTPGSSIFATAGPQVAPGMPQGQTAQDLQDLQQQMQQQRLYQMMSGGMGTSLNSSSYGGGYG